MGKGAQWGAEIGLSLFKIIGGGIVKTVKIYIFKTERIASEIKPPAPEAPFHDKREGR